MLITKYEMTMTQNEYIAQKVCNTISQWFTHFSCSHQGKSLSIVCGCLKWLTDHQEKETRRLEAILAGNLSALPSVENEEMKEDGKGK